ncbi:MAG: DUF4876 domain-containing protein [Bacteroidales bacterium]|nr:DUF4876 domain-containing protein [Bacteroidales bacterium]
MKRIIYTISAALLAISCTREAPRGTEPFLMEFRLPEELSAGAYYSGQKVYLNGVASYEFETDIRGMVTVESIIPGIYDIVTGMEITGAQYKAMAGNSVAVEDRARVNIGVSLMNQRIFSAQDLQIQLKTAILRDLMISKIYYSGTKDNMDRNYTTDSYIEIFNNSDEVAYIDGKYLGLAESVSPAAYPSSENPDSIFLRQVCRFPGSGQDYPVRPGGSVVVAARSARNHTESASTSIDLSDADFEVKTMEGSGNPDIPMLPLVTNSTSIATLNLLSGGPNAVVLFETDEDILSWPQVYQRGKTSGELFLRMHRKWVMDGVECLKKPAQTAPDVSSKRLQDDIDAGYAVITSVNGYNHESVERKVSRYEGGRYYLTDTNNSSVDFVILTDPTPRKYDKEGLQ